MSIYAESDTKAAHQPLLKIAKASGKAYIHRRGEIQTCSCWIIDWTQSRACDSLDSRGAGVLIRGRANIGADDAGRCSRIYTCTEGSFDLPSVPPELARASGVSSIGHGACESVSSSRAPMKIWLRDGEEERRHRQCVLYIHLDITLSRRFRWSFDGICIVWARIIIFFFFGSVANRCFWIHFR